MDTATTAPPAPDLPSPTRRLTRSRTDRIVGGVAGGVADYLGADPSLVRIAFIALTVFGGLGLLVYGAAWILVPEEPADGADPGPHRPAFAHWSRRNWVVAAVLGGIFLVAFSGRDGWWIPQFSPPGAAVIWLGAFALLAAWLFRRPRGRFLPRHLVRWLTLSVVALVVLVVGGTLGAEAMTGVPLSGDIGARSWRPATVAQIQPVYRTAIGAMTVDLRQVHFGRRPVDVTASVGIGSLLVEVPRGVSVDVRANSGIGRVVYGSGWPQTTSAGGRHLPRLVLNAQVGIGQVRLVGAGGATAGTRSALAVVAPAPRVATDSSAPWR